MSGWADNAVVYEIYPRSFQDTDGDGVGDLRGITERLPYLEWLGVDAIWIAPIYPSPNADFGYDISDHAAVSPEFGSLEDLDALVAEAHRRGIRVLLDLVPSHTSIEHPWFREHPDRYYVIDADEPPNNWVAAFGGPAWTRDPETGRLYMHSHFPEQPDLDWRNPETRHAMGEVVRFWIERGIDGFRVDAVDRMVKHADLLDDPPASDPFALPEHPDAMKLASVNSRNDPDIEIALAALREAAGEAPLFGEVYLPASSLEPYLRHLDATFAFDLLHADWTAESLAGALARSRAAGRVAWVMSNHDFPRVASRWGESNARAAALLLLCLGGAAFVYQGEEIGMLDGPEGTRYDRWGRDACRHPMQWTAEPSGGFSTGEPWLEPVDPERRSVESQRGDPASILNLFRLLISARREIEGKPEDIPGLPPGVVGFRRGSHAVLVNVEGEDRAPLPLGGEAAVESSPGVLEGVSGGPLTLARSGAVLLRLN